MAVLANFPLNNAVELSVQSVVGVQGLQGIKEHEETPLLPSCDFSLNRIRELQTTQISSPDTFGPQSCYANANSM